MFQPNEMPQDLAAILAAVRELSAQDLPSQSPEQRAARLVGLRQIIDQCEVEFLYSLAVFDAHGDGETLHCARNTASWLRGALALAPGDASERVLLSREADDHLKVAVESVQEGQTTYGHLRAIGSAVRRLPADAKPAGVQILTDLAPTTEPSTVRRVGRRMREIVDPDGALAAADHEFSRRWLKLSPMLDGLTYIEGVVDDEAATALNTALEPFLVPDGPEDTRSAVQRRADGLYDIARLVLDHQNLGDLGGAPPRLQVACDLPTLVATDGAPDAAFPYAPGSPRPVGRRDLDRITCDAVIARVLMTPEGIPFEFGRDQRLFTPQQRTALAIRDLGCRFPCCAFPPGFTDAHHINSWVQGGETNLDNALLLCRFHHRKVHRGGWGIEVHDVDTGANATVTFVGPNGQRMESDVGRATGAAETWWSRTRKPVSPAF